tara:strand:+ start:1259 stop:1741 length:483 start_codon:yes stop_codon:yes gene_type:complete
MSNQINLTEMNQQLSNFQQILTKFNTMENENIDLKEEKDILRDKVWRLESILEKVNVKNGALNVKYQRISSENKQKKRRAIINESQITILEKKLIDARNKATFFKDMVKTLAEDHEETRKHLERIKKECIQNITLRLEKDREINRLKKLLQEKRLTKQGS